MQNQKQVIDCYNKTAASYAGKYIDELQHKHLDRILLTALAQQNEKKAE